MNVPLIPNGAKNMADPPPTPDPTKLKTPKWCVAEFSLIPVQEVPASQEKKTKGFKDRYKAGMTKMVGAQPISLNASNLSSEIDDVELLMRRSGLRFDMHVAGTSVEGPWDDVMRLIGQMHVMLHYKGIVRLQTDIRVGSRLDMVKAVNGRLDDDEKQSQISKNSTRLSSAR